VAGRLTIKECRRPQHRNRFTITFSKPKPNDSDAKSNFIL
jgi:hypothetical protein